MSTKNASFHNLLVCILSLGVLVGVITHSYIHSLAPNESINHARITDIDSCDDFGCIHVAIHPSIRVGTYTGRPYVYPDHTPYSYSLLPETRAPPRIS